MSQRHCKTSVESLPFGTFSVSIHGCQLWAEDNQANKFCARLGELFQIAVADVSIQPTALRLVTVSNEFPTEVAYWQDQLSEPCGVTSNAAGTAVGKTLVWGGSEVQQMYGVIVLDEPIAFGILKGLSVAETTFMHELAHVDDSAMQLLEFGEEPSLKSSDWNGIRKAISRSTWSEFFAEAAAYRFCKTSRVEEAHTRGLEMLKECLRTIQLAICNYRTSRNLGELWQSAGNDLSIAFNQIGRSLGVMVEARADPPGGLPNFANELGRLAAGWDTVVVDLARELSALTRVERFQQKDFVAIESIVERGFNLAGLFPRPTEHGLLVDAPFQ
jgi:hypothetical protein